MFAVFTFYCVMQHGTRTGSGLGLDSVLVQHCSEEIHYVTALSGRLSF